VYTIQQRHAPRGGYQSYLDVAEKCQTQISSMGENDSLAKRYSVVLEELRLEAVRKPQQFWETPHSTLGGGFLQSGSTAPPTTLRLGHSDNLNSMQRREPSLVGDVLDYTNGTIPGDSQNVTTPSSLMADLTSWGEFDSLVSSFGLGSPS
jgi:hypothetical protein